MTLLIKPDIPSYQDTVHMFCAQAGLRRGKDFESETRINLNTVKTRINGPYARTLDLPLLVRSAFFYIFLSHGDHK